MIRCLLILGVTLCLTACQPNKQFLLLDPDDTGITFGNALTIRDSLNILDNELIYNGAGVSVGDWNGDGLPDLFFTANMEDNALYLNKGKLRFEDVTKQAGVSKPNRCWSAGSTVVDINADGKLDLYVSNMLHGQRELRQNLLYVNQGNDANGIPRFREMARDYGLAGDWYSAQTVFFDYDNDGDLDAYVLVNRMDTQFANQYFSKVLRDQSPTADRLLRNMTVERGIRGGKEGKEKRASLRHSPYSLSSPLFIDVSKEAGIETQGYGHGVSVMDINRDGWLDLYVTNDFLSNDNLFINNGGKGIRGRTGGKEIMLDTSSPSSPFFTDRAHDCLKHQSWSAMGNDVADINNDGLLDMIALDMCPDVNERKKALLRANNYVHYQFTEQYGYDYQHIRNTLQLNRGLDPQTGLPRFSDISQLAGVSETDWSWCPLWMDMDNDGRRDLLITNGFPKDITDQDFLAYRNDQAAVATSKADLYRMIPEVKIANYVYQNTDSLRFTDRTKDWGFDAPTFSNGAAYSDLDLDGDLDVVINNTNDYAHIYQNTLNDREHDARPHYLRIRLVGTALNPMGTGAKVDVWARGQHLYAEQNIVRGYLSTSEPVLHFGLGASATVDSVRITWPMVAGQQRTQVIYRPTADQILTVSEPAARSAPFAPSALSHSSLFQNITDSLGLSRYVDPAGDYIDFNIQKTLPHKFSAYGPALTVGDVNGDGLNDFVVGAAARSQEQLFRQQPNGRFVQTDLRLKTSPELREEDTGVLLFDADGDGDQDLYCVRGGYQLNPDSPLLQDVLFRNEGQGQFTPDTTALPRERANGRVVRTADYDRDGDLDLFVGGSVVPRAYPKPDRSYLLRNDGKGHFTDVTSQVAPELASIGIINDALWTDPDADGWPDLLLAGEWMPLTLMKNKKGHTFTHSLFRSLAQSGWWTSLCAGDFDGDGDLDYVAGNYGLNTAYHASNDEPLSVYASDFDQNGTYDAILAQYDNNAVGERHLYPYHTRDDLIKQSLLFRRRFLTYADFGRATFGQTLTPDDRKGALVRQVNELRSCYVENLGKGPDGQVEFRLHPLPVEAQFAPIMAMLATDINHDGRLDVLLAGNDFGMETFQGQADAGYGLTLLNQGKGRFAVLPPDQSGFVVSGDARALLPIRGADGRTVFIATQHRGPLQTYRLKK